MMGIRDGSVRRVALAAAGTATAVGGGVVLVGVARRVGSELWQRRPEIAFALRHVHEPAVPIATLQAARDVMLAERQLFRGIDRNDGGGDAFRHTYGQALITLRLARDHHYPIDRARALAREAGDAHELRGNGDEAITHEMDQHNNVVGRALVGNGLDANGRWLGERELRERTMAAILDGRVMVVDRATGTLRAASRADLVPVA